MVCPLMYASGPSTKKFLQGMIDLIKADADKAFDDLEFMDEADGLADLKIKQS